ncbi:MAG: acyltransferase [Bradyrhizobium sp.]|nr:acyltransferase [Bradyrhizobium sp.]
MAYTRQASNNPTMTQPEINLFWLRRFVRIYPLHFLVLLAMITFNASLTFYFALSGGPPPTFWSLPSLKMLAAQFLLINAWLPPPNSWNIPSWSISAEFVAYAIFPILVLAMARMRRTTTTLLFIGCAAFYAFGTAGPSLDITGGVGAPLRCLAGFTLGFVLHAKRDLFKRLPDLANSIAQLAAVGWIIAIMAVPSWDSLAIPGFALLIALTWRDRGVIARTLGNNRFMWLGEISYAVYIMHLLILNVLAFVWDRSVRRLISDASLERAIFIGTAYALVIVAAAIINVRFEKPVRARLVKTLSPWNNTKSH